MPIQLHQLVFFKSLVLYQIIVFVKINDIQSAKGKNAHFLKFESNVSEVGMMQNANTITSVGVFLKAHQEEKKKNVNVYESNVFMFIHAPTRI